MTIVQGILLAVSAATFIFVLAIGLVRVLGAMIGGDADPDGFPDEPPDTDRSVSQAGWPR